MGAATLVAKSGQKERGARLSHKRLLYCVKVNYTSLDHLLLGENADIDKVSSEPSITRNRREVRTIGRACGNAISILHILPRPPLANKDASGRSLFLEEQPLRVEPVEVGPPS